MGPGASIGPLNVIKDLEELRLAEGASIATRNWIVGIPRSADPDSDPFPKSPKRRPSLVMGKHAMITVAHEIDCSDLVEIGDYSSLAGFRCTILTHSLNLVPGPVRDGPGRDRAARGGHVGVHAAQRDRGCRHARSSRRAP